MSTRLGYLPFEPNAADLFFQLVSHRHERGGMLITSNRSVGEWELSSAIRSWPTLSSIVSSTIAKRSTIRGDSYRLREKRRAGLIKPATLDQGALA